MRYCPPAGVQLGGEQNVGDICLTKTELNVHISQSPNRTGAA